MKLKWENTGVKTPLARARGLGAAHDGVHHWLRQRITAIALVPLVIWLVYSILSLRGVSHDVFVGWLSHPLNAILMILTVVAAFYHAALGAQVIVEDYFRSPGLKMAKLIGIQLFFLAAGVACIFSILKVAL